MATASIALGIAALLSCTFFYISLPCGALAILCAILSRGRSRMSGKGKAGIICGVIGMIATVVITAAAFRTLLTDSQLRSNVELYIQYYLDDPQFSLDDMLGTFLPGFSGSDSNGSSSGILAGETEDESEALDNRVHLRVAPDEDETEAAAPAAETKPDAKTADTEVTEQETEQTEEETRSETKEKEIEQPEQSPEESAPEPTPRQGGSFI
jgi:hypothetical protein